MAMTAMQHDLRFSLVLGGFFPSGFVIYEKKSLNSPLAFVF
jgi:hypothetical protein